LLAPYFGASTIVWANTIGVVLVALSVGYRFGGRFADRHPSLRGLSALILLAALLIAVVPFAARPFLRFSVEAFESVSVGTFAGSLLGVLILVAVPVTLLGAAAPWAVRLAVGEVDRSGEVVGRLYASAALPDRGDQHPVDGRREGLVRRSPAPRRGLAAASTAAVGPRAADKLAPRLPGGEVYTDDRAPVEWLIDSSLLDYANE
jgi:MFS family permease